MNQVLDQKEAAIAEDEAAVRQVAARKEATAGKKTEAEEEWKELQDAWERCGATCAREAECPAVCPVAGMKRILNLNVVKL